MANLKELGLKINEGLIDEVNKLEEEIIKKEILPVLTEKIEPDFEMMAYENMGEMYHCWDDQFKQDCIDYYLAHKEDD